MEGAGLTVGDLERLLALRGRAAAPLREAASQVLFRHFGKRVFLRAALAVGPGTDWTLAAEAALWAVRQGFGSILFWSREALPDACAGAVSSLLSRLAREGATERMPSGPGVTLALGRQAEGTLSRWAEAAGSAARLRWLLPFVTADGRLAAALPDPAEPGRRLACLAEARRMGWQVGTGPAVGLPGQTAESLARDLLALAALDADAAVFPMAQAPGWTEDASGRMGQGLACVAAARLLMPRAHILVPAHWCELFEEAREMGAGWGASAVVVPLEPAASLAARLDDPRAPRVPHARDCLGRLESRLLAAGREIAWNLAGDAPRWRERTGAPQEGESPGRGDRRRVWLRVER